MPLAKTFQSDLPLKNKKVLILGNRSYKNMGDELILLGTIRILQEQNNEVIVSAYNPERLQSFFAQFPDPKPITYIHEFPKGFRSAFRYFFSDKRKELRTYRWVDAVIIGGGEILTEESVHSYRYRNLWLLPLQAKLNKTPVYLMGGIQIPKKKINQMLFRWLLSQTEGVFARDPESVEALKDFWYHKTHFFMDTSYFCYPRDKVESLPRAEKTVLINLNKNGEQFFEELIKECETLIATGFSLKYVPVSKGTSPVYNDLLYKNKLEKRLGITLPIVDRESDFNAFVQEVADAELVITARLHLFLVSSFIGTKVKVFPYQKKILKMQKMLQIMQY